MIDPRAAAAAALGGIDNDSFRNYAILVIVFPFQCTLHLKIKKLSTNSPRDFNSVLDTINHY